MVSIILAADLLKCLFNNTGRRFEQIKKVTYFLSYLCLLALLLMLALGYFYDDVNTKAWYIDTYIMTVSSLIAFSPVNRSEEYNNLGYGVILLLCAVITRFIFTNVYYSARLKTYLQKHWSLFLIVILSTCWSFGIGDKFEITKPLYETVKAVERFFWIVYYVIFFLTFNSFFLLFNEDRKYKNILFFCACLIQFIFIWIITKNNLNSAGEKTLDKSQLAIINSMVTNYETIVIYHACQIGIPYRNLESCEPIFQTKDWFNLAYAASHAGKGINLAYKARHIKPEKMENTLEDMQYVKDLTLQKKYDKDINKMLFVIIDDDLWRELIKKYGEQSSKLKEIAGYKFFNELGFN
jgi:hypothetical protein